MAIAITLKEFLTDQNIGYELLQHHHSDSSLNTAASANLPSDQVSKAVILKDEYGQYLMAVLPSDRKLQREALNRLQGKQYQMISEQEIESLFADCELGAIPALGEAYGMDTVVDDHLLMANSVYIEAGDHETLVKLNNLHFCDLVKNFHHGKISGDLMDFQDLNNAF